MQKKLFKRLAILVVFYIAINIFLSSMTKEICLKNNWIQGYNFYTTIAIILNTGINILALFLINKLLVDKMNIPVAFKRSKENRIRLYLLGSLLGIVLMIMCIFIRYLCNLIESFDFIISKQNMIIFVLGCIIIFCQVIVEEYLFRNIIYYNIRNVEQNIIKSIFINSFVFIIFHISSSKGLIDYLFLFLFAALMAYWYENTRNMWMGVGFHFGWNLIADGIQILEISYVKKTDIQMIMNKGISILIITCAIIMTILVANKLKGENLYESEIEK